MPGFVPKDLELGLLVGGQRRVQSRLEALARLTHRLPALLGIGRGTRLLDVGAVGVPRGFQLCLLVRGEVQPLDQRRRRRSAALGSLASLSLRSERQ